MCQLTIINSNNYIINKNFLNLLLYNNSLNNPDGTGVFSYNTKSIVKSKHPAYNLIDDLEEFLTKNKSNLYIAHVRKASTNRANINEKFAHPFNVNNYLVFHNGTFDKMPINADTTDTLEFAKLLDENYSGNIINDFNKVYKGGKFALIIYDKNKDKIFILKGDSANLYKFELAYNNTTINIINTEEETLLNTVNQLNIASKFFKIKNDIKIINVEDIPKNTCYEYNINDGKLIKIGEIKEIKYAYTTFSVNDTNTKFLPTTGRNTFLENLKELSLSLEIDLLLHKNYGINLSSTLSSTYLEKLYLSLINYYSPDKYKIWKKVLKSNNNKFLLDIYKDFNLKVPYFMNSEEDLLKCI